MGNDLGLVGLIMDRAVILGKIDAGWDVDDAGTLLFTITEQGFERRFTFEPDQVESFIIGMFVGENTKF